VYVNSLLAALNIRMGLRRQLELGDLELVQTKMWPSSPGRIGVGIIHTHTRRGCMTDHIQGHGRSESLAIKVDTVLEKSVDSFPVCLICFVVAPSSHKIFLRTKALFAVKMGKSKSCSGCKRNSSIF
jgi:hypothetical protein